MAFSNGGRRRTDDPRGGRDDRLVAAHAALRRAQRARPAGALAVRYRLYGPAELQRLRTLRELLERFEVGLSEIGFALRMRRDPDLRVAIEEWFEAEARRPEHIDAADWLRWEQEKHQRLLNTRLMETTPR